MDRQLKKIATAARREMESFARWNKDSYSVKDLACYCAIASYFLVMLGRKFGYKMTLVEGVAFDNNDIYLLQNGEEPGFGANHFWVEYNGKIIDLTATQFDSTVRKVHVVDDDDENYWRLNQHNAARKNLRTIWPHCQSPYPCIAELRQRANKIKTKLAA